MKAIYQADDGELFDTPQQASNYELFVQAVAESTCPYIERRSLAMLAKTIPIIQQRNLEELINETLSSSISPEQDPSESLDVAVRTS